MTIQRSRSCHAKVSERYSRFTGWKVAWTSWVSVRHVPVGFRLAGWLVWVGSVEALSWRLAQTSSPVYIACGYRVSPLTVTTITAQLKFA